MEVQRQCSQPFLYDGSFDVFTYRIPCLLTLNDGDLMAATDLCVSILDSPNNIEIGVRVLNSQTGEWGHPIVAHLAESVQTVLLKLDF